MEWGGRPVGRPPHSMRKRERKWKESVSKTRKAPWNCLSAPAVWSSGGWVFPDCIYRIPLLPRRMLNDLWQNFKCSVNRPSPCPHKKPRPFGRGSLLEKRERGGTQCYLYTQTRSSPWNCLSAPAARSSDRFGVFPDCIDRIPPFSLQLLDSFWKEQRHASLHNLPV